WQAWANFAHIIVRCTKKRYMKGAGAVQVYPEPMMKPNEATTTLMATYTETWGKLFKSSFEVQQATSKKFLEALHAHPLNPVPETVEEKQALDAEDPEKVGTDYLRFMFHQLADMNLTAWEHAATLLQAMPAWAKLPNEVAGRALTDWFDEARRSSGGFAWPGFTQTSSGMFDGEAEEALKAAGEATKEAAPSNAPDLLPEPESTPDDLTRIKGIGPKLSERLNELGVFHFWQIAEWTPAQGEWIDEAIAFKGRVAREDWPAQAAALMN
ncbi:MAG: hypothetical protein AAFX02_03145, partial [Pseudomonadota bacterium]